MVGTREGCRASNGKSSGSQVLSWLIVVAVVAGGIGYYAGGQRKAAQPTEARKLEIFHWQLPH